MKSVILDGYTVNAGDLSWEAIESAGSLTVYDRTKDSEITDRIGDCDVVFTSKCHITREVMDACPGIKFIGVMATGYDNVDIEAAKDKNIAVCNVPSYSTEGVAQHTFALLLELCNRVGPVSYTHLDVYKRQQYNHHRKQRRILCEFDNRRDDTLSQCQQH